MKLLSSKINRGSSFLREDIKLSKSIFLSRSENSNLLSEMFFINKLLNVPNSFILLDSNFNIFETKASNGLLWKHWKKFIPVNKSLKPFLFDVL